MGNIIKGRILLCCCLLFTLVIVISPDMDAQQTNHNKVLDEILKSDGSIEAGITGSYSADGYDIQFGANGEPTFKKSALRKAQSTAAWSSMGTGRTGITNYDGSPGKVYAVAVNSVGDIYVGGWFRLVGDIVVNSIAKWDVSENCWAVLPCGSTNGVNGTVETIAINGTDVYVAGTFTKLADETLVNYIAKYDETTNTWSALTDNTSKACGVYNEVLMFDCGIYDIGFMGGVLYVGGDFLKLGDGKTAAKRVAKWDGTNWYPLVSSGGINGIGKSSASANEYVDALEVSGDKVYIGGGFATLGDGSTTVNNITVWNETADSWSALTSNGINGITGAVCDIAISGTSVYIGGEFSKLGDNFTVANNIVKWVEGTGWFALNSDLVYGVNGAVSSIRINGTDVYVSGAFTNLDDNSLACNYLAKWDGTFWSRVSGTGNGVDGIAYALAINGSKLYVSGCYKHLGDLTTNAYSVAAYNISSDTWSTFGSGDNGVDDAVRAVVVNGDYVYVGGYFTTINAGTPAKHVARWNYKTKAWSEISSLTTGIDTDYLSKVYAMAVSGNYLYVAGVFNSINKGTVACNIAKYDLLNNTWSALYDAANNIRGVSGKIATITVDGDNVYVGGEFMFFSNGTNGLAANRVAKWNESSQTWSALTAGSTNGVSDKVLCSAVNGDLIYFGGYFNNLACWNKTSNLWTSLSDAEFNLNIVRAIAINGDDIYIGCEKAEAPVVKWDPTNGWTAIDADSKHPQLPIYSLSYSNDYLYVGGAFTQSYDLSTSAQGLMKWSSTSGWEALPNGSATSTGVNNCIYSFALSPGEGKMYVGGYFSTAGGQGAVNAASFTETGNPLPVELISLCAARQNDLVVLNWQTATEVNNIGFSVERSCPPDGNNWATIGFVQGSGNSNSPRSYSFTDTQTDKTVLKYRLKQIDTDGKYKYSDVAEVNMSIPATFALNQNYPNPFNPATVISYQIPAAGLVTLKVYDLLGKEVSTLVNEQKNAGTYEIKFDGGKLSSGVYYYQLVSGSFVATRKFILMK